MPSSHSPEEAKPGGLPRDAVSLPGAVALAAAAMAPTLAVVLNAPAAAPAAGDALPLAFLIAFFVCVLVGNTVIRFARRLSSSGSFYAYNTRGFGKAGGFFTGWLFCLGYAILAPGLFTALGDFARIYVHDVWGVEAPWWLFSLAGLALVASLSLRGIRTSVGVDLASLVVEVGLFLALAVIALVGAGSGRTLSAFTTTAAPAGWAGMGQGVVFGVLSFVGFDAAATPAEETRSPRRNVPLAVGGTLVFVGLFYLVAIGAMVAAGTLNESNPFLALARKQGPWLGHPVALCAIAGIFSCLLAIHNTTARILFCMGRDGVLPRVLGSVHPRWSSPAAALHVQTAFTAGVGLPLGVWFGPGANGAYGLTGAIGAVALLLVWMMGHVALICDSFRARDRRSLIAVAAPALGVAALAYPLWATLAAGEQEGQEYHPRLVPAVVASWLVAGVCIYLSRQLWSRTQEH